MTIWADHQVENRIVEILQAVPIVNDQHQFGRPYMTAYQLAIRLNEQHPEIARALGYEVGGRGIGHHNSLAQYVARELSKRIGRDDNYVVQGAFVSNVNLRTLIYRTPEGEDLESSLTDSGFDLSMFRLRPEGT
jgi:hypothetical protein